MPFSRIYLLSENTNNILGSENAPVAPYNEVTADASTHQQTMEFADGNPGDHVVFEGTDVSTFDSTAMSDLGLGDFLQRPVLIDTFNWTESNFAAHTFDPWTLFFRDGKIRDKTKHYGLIRANLHLKFVISASPFYYGMCLVSYNPYPSLHPGPQVVLASDEQLVTYSQRPHIILWPAKSQGGEMDLPFFHPENWMVNRAANIAEMGEIRYDSPDILRNANSVAGANVTIRCYAWATDIELAQPTMFSQGRTSKAKFVKKSKKGRGPSMMDRVEAFSKGREDEYDGPVSSVASAVANASSHLKAVPIIGPMARATEIGAGAISRVAAWFGYTNVPVIDDVAPYKDIPFGGFANSSIGTPTAKLTLDPKNELTLDSRTVGLDGTDELALESFCSRPSYLYVFDWDTSDAPDDYLMVQSISPSLFYREDSNRIWSTPMCHAASMYQYWSGSIILTFRFICTQYHRGRVKIVYEPATIDFALNPPNETAQITKIIDIGETQEIEICVPFMQGSAFLGTRPFIAGRTNYLLNSSPFAFSSFGANGQIFVQVSNELTSPVANAPVKVAVFARAGPDFKLMGPVGPPNSVEWISQGSSWNVSDDEMCMGDLKTEEPDLYLVYGGETAMSLRQLCQRHTFIRATADVAGSLYQSNFYLYPYSLSTTSNSKNIHSAGAAGTFNYVNNSPVAYLAPCFAGMRGSMHWAYVPFGETGTVTISRAVGNSYSPSQVDTTYTNGGAGTAVDDAWAAISRDTTYVRAGSGAAVYPLTTQSGSTALVPFISNQRFVGTWPSPWANAMDLRTYATPLSIILEETIDASAESGPPAGHFYCAAGPDFNVFFFTGVPTLQFVTAIPQPAI